MGFILLMLVSVLFLQNNSAYDSFEHLVSSNSFGLNQNFFASIIIPIVQWSLWKRAESLLLGRL